MNKRNNKRTAVLAIILLGLLVIAYKSIFMSSPVDIIDTNEDSQVGDNSTGILGEIDGINFDTTIIDDKIFKSLKSLEIPLASIPIGRRNPFSSVSGSN